MWTESKYFSTNIGQKNLSTLTETKPVKKDRVNETDSASRTYLRKQTEKWSIVRFVLKGHIHDRSSYCHNMWRVKTSNREGETIL